MLNCVTFYERGMANNNRLGELLVREKLISLAQLRRAQEEQQKSGQNLGYALSKLGFAFGPLLREAVPADTRADC